MRRTQWFFMGRLVVTIFLMGGILFWAVRTLDIEEIKTILSGARWAFLVPSIMLNLVVLGFIVLRWQLLLNRRARFRDCLIANLIGAYFNTFLPLRLGDLARTYVLQRHAPKLSKVAVLSSIGAELTFDMLILMLFLGIVLMLLPLPALLTQAGALLALLTGVAMVSIFFFARSDSVAENRVFRLLPGRLEDVAMGLVSRVQDGVSGLKQNRQFLLLFVLTLAEYLIQVVANWLLLMVFLEDVPLYAGMVAVVGAGLGLATPLLPGSAGTYELAVTLALTSMDILPEAAAAFALMLHAQQIGLTLVMGSLAMLAEGVSVSELRQAVETTKGVGGTPSAAE